MSAEYDYNDTFFIHAWTASPESVRSACTLARVFTKRIQHKPSWLHDKCGVYINKKSLCYPVQHLLHVRNVHTT